MAIPGWRPKVSAFDMLPVELILEIMGHTASDDLKSLILTEKFMNETFKKHKKCIFKGPVSGDSRTSEQTQCLKEVVLSFDWRGVVPMTSGGTSARLFLHLLEWYGGWRYLYFLTSLKGRMENDAQFLHMWLEGRLDMTGEQAKAMVLCLSRMSWKPAVDEGDGTGGNAGMSEVDRIAEVRMRVEDRLKFFRKEPPAFQQLMTKTLTYLTFFIAHHMRLDKIATGYQRFYLPLGMGSLTKAQRVAGWEDLVSRIMTKTLLGCLFFFGVTNVMRLCEDAWKVKFLQVQLVILGEFKRQMDLHLQAVSSGTLPQVDSCFLAGSLWAAGLDFPTLGWIFTNGGWIN